jgi:hypothetical protein
VIGIIFSLLLNPIDTDHSFWDQKCLKKEMAVCGKDDLSKTTKFDEHQKQVFMCRVKALNKCRLKD